MLGVAKRRHAGLVVLVGLWCAPGALLGQDGGESDLPEILYACYVPGSGVVYRVNPPTEAGKYPKLKDECSSKNHVLFSWTVGLPGHDHGNLDGLADDDHPQYLLADGSRALTGALSAGSNKISNLAEATTAGDAVRYEQAIKGGDAAGGDLSGTYPDPTVAGIQGRTIVPTPPADGQVLTWNTTTSAWEPTTPAAGVSDHGLLDGLTDDDHARYVLADGVRSTVNGFAVTGTRNAGSLPTTGSGVRVMWYPGKAAFRAGWVENAGGWNAWEDVNIGEGSVAMGYNARASGPLSLAIGERTEASGYNSTALGERTTASGTGSTALGILTAASGWGSFAVGSRAVASGNFSVAMGERLSADAEYTVALGRRVSTNGHRGSLVFGDRSTEALTSITNVTAEHSFVVRAQHVWFGKSGDQVATGGRYIETSTGAYLSNGGAWTNASDRERKENFRSEDGEVILAKIARLPIQSWNYKSEDPGVRHLGPTAQDFYAGFRLGDSEKVIPTVDIDGVNMLAVQALERRTHDLSTALATVKADNQQLRARLVALEGTLQRLESAVTRLPK